MLSCSQAAICGIDDRLWCPFILNIFCGACYGGFVRVFVAIVCLLPGFVCAGAQSLAILPDAPSVQQTNIGAHLSPTFLDEPGDPGPDRGSAKVREPASPEDSEVTFF